MLRKPASASGEVSTSRLARAILKMEESCLGRSTEHQEPHSFQIVVAFTLTAMAALALVNLRASNYELERIQYARQQLAATAQLAISANRFG